MTQIRSVAVLGGGMMGSGIAHVCAAAGFETVVREVTAAMGQRAQQAVERSLARAVERGKLAADARDAALARLRYTTELDALAQCDLVIEAVVEDLEVKNRAWRELDAICRPDAIFATNTSSLTVAAMAAVTARADRVVGLHFFNPVPVMRLVEVVRTVTTSDATVAEAFAFARAIGKEPIAAKDVSGFVVNLLLVPYLFDAITQLERGIASVHDLDVGMKLGAGHPMGPLELCDFVGLDTLQRIGEIMFAEYRERRYAPPPLLRRMVLAGMHGRKSGRGFYDYTQDPPKPSALGL
ncbi:3-hydroxyacyl-CoA dehydrogenase family protein [Roseisolibacter agri]|uniref:3-hydroxybutyryl-CoA dehydrogenase n=1 Tax=Roseisolibacter agri TaxID=2014610 RepID=A0AA37V204_9BACT|nr:3-hydroxybutyryl-CoA dehydrogenase [Roseisolibacter agri]GLC27070.1 3-hydroxybutyryl-CoA dehydrogenase [Roseisolibacter agri]